MKTKNLHKAKHRILPKKLLSLLLATVTLFMSVPFAFTSFAKNSDTNYTTSKANVLEQKLSAENKNLPSGANDFELTATVDTSLNSGNGGIILDWSSYNRNNTIYKGYQSVDGGKNWQSMSMMDYDKVEEIKVLNIYPTATAGWGGNTMPTITFTSSIDNQSYELAQSASLKRWMEESVTGAEYGYGKKIIKVTPVAIDVFNINPSMIYNYDVAFLGSWDSNGHQNLNDSAVDVVSNYIEKGYGFITGHDTIGLNWGSTGISKLREKFKIKIGNYCSSYSYPDVDFTQSWGYMSSQVVIKKKGLFTSYPWNIGEIGDILDITETHSSSQSAGGDVWLEFTNGSYTWAGIYWGLQPDELTSLGYNGRYYLTTNNNVAMVQTGHSIGKATEDEQKILANLIFYCYQLSSLTNVTDYSGMDTTPPKTPTVSFTKNTSDITVNFSSVDDGNQYMHYIQAYDKSNFDTPIAQSNTTTSICATGTKGYYYVIDSNPTNDFDKSIAEYTTDTSLTIKTYNANDYVHIKAVDNAGNISAVTDVKLPTMTINYKHKLYSFENGTIDLPETPVIKTTLPTTVNYAYELDLTGKETTYDGKIIYRAPTCDGYIFCGWYLDDELTTPAFSGNTGTVKITENTTLYTKWIPVGEMTLSQDDKYKRTDESDNTSGFEMYGVQVRMKAEGDMGRGMRFVTRIRADLLNEIRKATGHNEKKPTSSNDDSFEPYDENASYGYMMKAQEVFSKPDKCNYDPLQMVEVSADKNHGRYADFDDYFLFTGVITNIKENKFDTNFSATAYIKYIDANGVERRYCYTESEKEDTENVEYKGVYHTTLRKAAEAYLGLDSIIHFTNAQLNYLNYIVNCPVTANAE